MRYRLAEYEKVEYRVDDVIHATITLVRNFADYSGIEGTEYWVGLVDRLLSDIRNRSSFHYFWEATGLEVHFAYFLKHRPVIRDGKLTYISPEPRISFFEKPGEVRPSTRTHIGRVIQAITREMEEVYHLQIENDPVTLTFTKEEYASAVKRYTVPILI